MQYFKSPVNDHQQANRLQVVCCDALDAIANIFTKCIRTCARCANHTSQKQQKSYLTVDSTKHVVYDGRSHKFGGVLHIIYFSCNEINCRMCALMWVISWFALCLMFVTFCHVKCPYSIRFNAFISDVDVIRKIARLQIHLNSTGFAIFMKNHFDYVCTYDWNAQCHWNDNCNHWIKQRPNQIIRAVNLLCNFEFRSCGKWLNTSTQLKARHDLFCLQTIFI